jgi:endonuclease G
MILFMMWHELDCNLQRGFYFAVAFFRGIFTRIFFALFLLLLSPFAMAKSRSSRSSGLPRNLSIALALLLIAFGAFKSCQQDGTPQGTPQQSQNKPPTSGSGGQDTHTAAPAGYEHLAMGIPTDKDASDDYILRKSQYALSYNKNLHVPNWVSSHLTAANFGDVPRFQGKFIPDADIPNGMYRVRHDDYTGSGYDRGHMVRSEERTDTPENNQATFLTTNLLPQTHDLNAGPWLRLEELCQRLAQRSKKSLYIICGGVFSKNPQMISKGRVAVPEQCFKIVVVLNAGQSVKNINANTTVLAVMMPNVKGIARDDWRKYVVSVDDIEAATGYDFLTALPVEVQKALESSKADVRSAS